MDLMKELDDLDYHDEEIWQKCWDTIGNKKRINNLTFLAYFNEMMQRFNTDPKSPFYQKLDGNIAKLKEKHYNSDREWRYNFEAAEFRSIHEIISKREELKWEDTVLQS